MTDAAMDRSVPPPPGAIRDFDPPVVNRHDVAGGIPVLSALTPGIGVGTIGVLFRCGVCSEPLDRAGMLKCVAQTMDTGAEGRSAREIAEWFEGRGLGLRIVAGWDEFSVLVTGLPERVVEGVESLARVVCAPDFPDSEIVRVRNELASDLRQREMDPRSLATDAAYRFLYHPHERISRPVSGTDTGLSATTPEIAREAHRAVLGAGPPTFLIAGDLDTDACLRAIDGAFSGRFESKAGSPPVELCGPPRTRGGGRRLVLVHRPEAAQAEIRVGHAGLPRTTPTFDACRVANVVLGGAFSSRLNLNLRERRGYTYGASSRFVFHRHGGPFLVSTAVGSEVVGPAVREILGELDAIRSAPPSDTELEDARNYLAGTFPLRMQTVSGLAASLAEIAVHELPTDYFERYQERVMEVSPQAAHAAASEAVRPEAAIVVVCGDLERVRPSLDREGIAGDGPALVVDRALEPIQETAGKASQGVDDSSRR